MALSILLWGGLLLVALAALTWIDVRTYRLPDWLTLPLICAGLLQSWHLTGQVLAAAIGAIAGYTAFVAVEVSFRALRRKDGLGRGDAKLLAAGGAWCSWMGLPWIVMFASTSGLLFAGILMLLRRKSVDVLPFGPFLAFGIFLVWVARILACFP